MRKRLLIASALLLFALPAAGVLWLLHTQAGLQWAVAQLGHFRTFDIKIEGVTGTLAGPLSVRRFELDHPRVHVVLNDLNADFRLSGLFLLSVNARAVSGRDGLVEMRRVPESPDSGKATRFLPRLLRINARDITLTNVRYVNMNGFTLDADRVAAKHVRMSSTDLRVEDFEAQAPWVSARGNYEMHSARPLRLAADAAGTLRAPEGVPLEVQAKLAGNLDELLMEAQLKSPDVANVRATLTRPNDSWRIAGRIASSSLGLDGIMKKPPFRFEDVALRFEVIPEHIHADGALTIPGVGPLLADAAGQFADKRLTITRADVRARDSNARVLASGSVQFGGESAAIDANARWTQLQYPLTGRATVRSAEGQLKLNGSMPYTFTVSGALGGEQVPAATLTANGVLSKEDVRLDAYAVRTLKGSLAGSGRMRFDKPQQWSIDAVAANLDPAPLYADAPGRVSFTAQAHGSGLDRNAYFDVRVDKVQGELRGERVRGHGRVERVTNGWRLHDVNARWSTSRVAASGLIGKRLDVQWSMRVRSLRRFIPEFRGQVISSGRATGALETPHVVATLDASNVRLGDWRIGAVQVDGDVDAGSDRPSRLTLHASNVGLAQPWFSDVQLDAAGNRAAHDLVLTVLGTSSETDAAARGQMKLRGGYKDGVWTTQIYDINARDDIRELKLQQATQAVLARDHASLDPLCLVIATGTVCAQGTWQRNGAWSAQAQLDALPLAALLGEHEDEQRLTGTMSGSARGGATAGVPWQGEANLRVNDAVLHYKLADGADEDVQLGSGALTASADAARYALNVDLRALENTFVRGEVQLARTGVALTSMPMQGEIKARTADANVLPLLVPDIDRAAGVMEADIELSGNLAAPGIDGRVALNDGELDSYRVNLALRELQATAQLQDTGLTFNASAKAGDGALSTNGRLQWEQHEPRGWLRLSGKDLLVADLPEYRVVASPDLTFQLAGRKIDVSGDVLIPSARIQPADLSGAVRLSDDARLIDERAAGDSGFIVASTIRTIIGDDVRLDTFGLQGQLLGEVTTVVHTSEDPIGRGELNIKEGRYEAYGQKLDITRGRLLMDNTPLDDPALDIQAERKLEEIKLGLNVRGTLRAPRLSFFSEPSMPQTQIVEYLLVGGSLDDYQNRDAQASGSTGNSLALQGGGLLASRLGRRIGLEEVGVESDVNTGAALVLGKFLSPRLF
ncbi:MAG: translocation/assembly module TamB domain-containing protein, partial [Steroidobacteraceae bacterium]